MRIKSVSGRGIKGLSFDVPVGPVHVFVGANGSGKSAHLLAAELALAGASKGDRRAGDAEVQEAGVSLDVDRAVASEGTVVVARGFAPKPRMYVAPFGGSNAALAAKLGALVGVPPTTFKIGAFIELSDDKQRAALLRLAAPTSSADYQGLAPDILAFKDESASSWIERAIKLKADELAAFREKKRTAKTVTTGLANAAQGQAANVDALMAEKASLETEIETRRRAGAQHAAREALEACQKRYNALPDPMPVDAAPVNIDLLKSALRALQDRSASAAAVKRKYDGLLEAYQNANADLATVAERQQAVRKLILSILDAVKAGATTGTLEDLALLQVELDAEGYPASAPLVALMSKLAKEASALAPVAPPTADEMQAANAAIERAVAANATLNQRRMEVARAKDARSNASIEIGRAQAEVDRFGPAPIAITNEPTDSLQTRINALSTRIIEAAKATATEQTELRLLGTAASADTAIEIVKRTITDLKEGLDRCLRLSLTPVAETMDPLLATFGARFVIGRDVPLGFERDGLFIPLDAASRSEQAVYLAGLALAFASREAGKLRLVMFDDLDTCDAERAPAVLEAAVRLVAAGKLDNVFATTCHPIGAIDGVTITQVG